MARFPLTGLGKRECARLYGKSKSAVHYWLSPLSEDRCPPAEFLRFLDKQIEQRAPVIGAVRCAWFFLPPSVRTVTALAGPDLVTLQMSALTRVQHC
jgi:hypothetical protein